MTQERYEAVNEPIPGPAFEQTQQPDPAHPQQQVDRHQPGRSGLAPYPQQWRRPRRSVGLQILRVVLGTLLALVILYGCVAMVMVR